MNSLAINMISQHATIEIQKLWDNYLANNKRVANTKGSYFDNINQKRLEAIAQLRKGLNSFLIGNSTLREFRTFIDGFNKRHNYWGFTAIKGQMFFNLLVRDADNGQNIDKVTTILRATLTEPSDLDDALHKIESLEKYLSVIFNKAPDKRKVANPSSVGYFLSYFWQIQNHEKWPIMYTSMIKAFEELNIWRNPSGQRESYLDFYNLNEESKEIISKHNQTSVSNWDVEHTYWILKIRETSPKLIKQETIKSVVPEVICAQEETSLRQAGFDIYDFIPPITAKLIEQGNETQLSSATKGSKFERTVCEIFKLLGFEVTQLGQGQGREPDLIAKYKEDGIAFIIDAKAYTNGYVLSAGDERAIREYISYYSPKLQREGIKKIAFIIVSNSFREGFENFINDITWNTDMKRFVLLESDSLLHLLAYKMNHSKHITDIIDALIQLEYTIKASDIIQRFEDV